MLAIVVNGVNHMLFEEHYLDPANADNRIIGAALGLQLGGSQVELVSNDAALRIKAAHVGLAAKDYVPVPVPVPVPASGRAPGSPGWRMIDGLDGALLDRVFGDRGMEAAEVPGADALGENEFAVCGPASRRRSPGAEGHDPSCCANARTCST